jgi:hypothetical protein
VFCVNTKHGAIDIFRRVPGLADWSASARSAKTEQTGGGIEYNGLSDADMLRCQLALDPPAEKIGRIAVAIHVRADAMSDSLQELMEREQAKRDRNWDPAVRRQAYLNTLAWAESQATVLRNTKEACLAHQQRLLAQLATQGEA